MNPSSTAEVLAAREKRLDEIRREAAESGSARVDQTSASKASAENGYYGTPLLKRPQWTVEVPIYFFVGGMAGAASLIAAACQISQGDARLIRDARWIAAIGGVISPALLIADLGMPSRFLNMLRVFKIQSPMSVGSWTLVAFSNSAAATALLGEFQRRRRSRSISVLTNASQTASALTGLLLATYTGVLIGATVIPAWNEHVSTLPIHFAASGVAAAASALELRGNRAEALNKIAMGAAAIETFMGASIELNSSPGSKALKSGVSGLAMRGAGVLSGPLPLGLRLLSLGSKRRRKGFRRAAALSSLAGSLLTRWAWVRAGRSSAEDASVPLQLKPRQTDALESNKL